MIVRKKEKWICFGIIFSILFILYIHEDGLIIINSEINFLRSIVEGNGVFCNAVHDPYDAPYGFIPYLIMGIWGAPLYLLIKIMGEISFGEKTMDISDYSIKATEQDTGFHPQISF